MPGSLADAIQLAVSMGMLDAKLGMPILEVAGNQDDRKMLGGMPGSREMVPTGCATLHLSFYQVLFCSALVVVR